MAETSLEPDFAHMKVVLVGRKFAENYPVHAIVDYLLRRRDIQDIGYLIADPYAKDVLSHTAKDSNVPGSEIFMKFGQGTKSPYAQGTRLYEFYRSVFTPGESLFCPVVNIEDGNIVVNRVAVFGRDFRMKYILPPEETETFKILVNMSNSALIDLQTPTHKPYSAHMLTIGTKYKFTTGKDNTITCNINIMGTTVLEETPNPFPNIEELNGIFSSRLSKEALDLIRKLQDEKLDPLFIERMYWASNPSYDFTNEWPETIFPNIKFNVNTKIKLLTTGTLR
jgi:spore germination protein KC